MGCAAVASILLVVTGDLQFSIAAAAAGVDRAVPVGKWQLYTQPLLVQSDYRLSTQNVDVPQCHTSNKSFTFCYGQSHVMCVMCLCPP